MRFIKYIKNFVYLLIVRVFNKNHIVYNNRYYFLLDLNSPNFYNFRLFVLKFAPYIPMDSEDNYDLLDSDGLVKSYVLNVFDSNMCFMGYTRFYFNYVTTELYEEKVDGLFKSVISACLYNPG